MADYADPFGSQIAEDGVPRQRSQCKIIVFSHIDNNDLQGKIDLSQDVIACDTSKTIVGGGQASFILVPRRNYLNYIFPNDYVYIYFDPGDGRGFVRTFFGFVDRIGRIIRVDPSDGRTNTQFQVTCSDFTKAFDKTNLYFNPYISNREDVLGEFAGTANLGGYALRNKGLAMYGSPADLVMSILELTCGFGGQFMLPKSLARLLRGNLIEVNRKKRVEWARSRLSETVRAALVPGATDLEKEIEVEATRQAQSEVGQGQEPTRQHIDEKKDEVTAKRGLPARFWNTQEFRAARTVEAAAGADAPAHLLDLIDFRFVEWKAIDGFCTSISITWEEGSLWSIANGYSNYFLNELFCDLRPMEPEVSSGPAASGANAKKPKETTEAGYAVELDEIGENTGAVRFAPCVIMREYPFGTIEGINPPSTVKVLQKQIGLVYFGALFSKEPNKPGRKTIQIPSLHPEVFLKSKGKETATKHLDVHVISIKDIVQENIGRSDADHFNLLEVYCDVTSGQIQHSRFLTQEIQPITQAIGVARHGVRVRKHNSRFGRFGMFAARAGVVDSDVNRRVLVRWSLLLDHWYQHNIEYLNGTMVTRAFPEVRVGCRLDVKERRESYYIEGVNHSWSYPQTLTTTLTLSRGQRNDPFPVYIYPQRKGFQGVRNDKGRLAQYFLQMDPDAVARASAFPFGDGGEGKVRVDANYVDDPNQVANKKTWGKNVHGYVAADTMGTNDEELAAALGRPMTVFTEPFEVKIPTTEFTKPFVVDVKREPGSSSGGADL